MYLLGSIYGHKYPIMKKGIPSKRKLAKRVSLQLLDSFRDSCNAPSFDIILRAHSFGSIPK